MYLINNTWNKNIKSTPWLCFHGWQNCDVFDRRAIVKEEYTPTQGSLWAQKFVEKRNRELAKLYRLDLNRKVGEFTKLHNDYLSKATKSQLNEGDLCLVYQFQPRGTCGKIFNNWKGCYIIEKQLDKNVFLISLTGNRRRKFMIHRHRLRKIEDVKRFNEQIRSGDGVNLDEDSKEEPLELPQSGKVLEEGEDLGRSSPENLEEPDFTDGSDLKDDNGPSRLRSGRIFRQFD